MSDKDSAQGPTERHPEAVADDVHVEPKPARAAKHEAAPAPTPAPKPSEK